MGHRMNMAAGGRALWRWAATLALLLTLVGGGIARVAAAAAAHTPADPAQAAQHPPHDPPPGDARQVTTPSGAAAAGLAAPNGGTVDQFGYQTNLYFCNGDATGNDIVLPKPNPTLGGVTAVGASEYTTMYLLSDGTVYSCGSNGQGVLGNGTARGNAGGGVSYGVPQQVLGVCPTTAAVPPSGGTTAPATPGNTATACGHLANIKAIANGYRHSLALDTAGNVYAWGDNQVGELGTGVVDNSGPEICAYTTQTNGGASPTYYSRYQACSTTPVRVPGLTNVVQIVAGDDFSVALKADGSVVVWGANYDSQLAQPAGGPQRCGNTFTNANGATTPSSSNDCSATPIAVAVLPAISQVATGMDADTALALDTTGRVWAWGYNGTGDLGRGTVTRTGNSGEAVPAPVLGPGGTGILGTGPEGPVAQPDPARPYLERIGFTLDTGYAAMADGTVYAWGYNNHGDLGIGNKGSQATPPPGGPCFSACYTYPMHVLGVDGAGFLGGIAGLGSGGDDTAYAIAADGHLYAWGYGRYGQLGNGVDSGPDRTTPALVLGGTAAGPLTGVLAVAANDNDSTLAVIAAPAPQAAPAAIDFGGQAVGTTSGSRTIVVTNTGGGPLTVSGATLGGPNAAEFAVDGGCVGTVAPDASCQVNVTFTPAAAGARSATVTIATSAGATTTTLTGNGSVARYTVTAGASGNGTVTPAGATTYNTGTVATYTATAAAGQTFTGWTLDGRYVGYATPLTVTVTADHALTATFVATPRFSDIGSLPAADQQAITFLAALGIINPNGVNGSGQFQPNNDVVRAEMAAFIARTFGWEAEFHGNTFPDRCDPANPANCIDAKLWNDVAALKDYGIVGGYTDAPTCSAAGTTAPCYLPRDGVKRVQAVSIVARAFIKTPDLRPTGFWDRLAADPAQYTDIGTEGTQRADLTTYRQNAGPIPCQQSDATFGTCQTPTGVRTAQDSASRLFVIQVLYQAFNAQFGVDRVP